MKIKTGTQAVIILTFILFDLCFIQAQSMDSISYKKNAVYLEGLGNAGFGLYSINYERQLIVNTHGFYTLRLGSNFFPNNYFSPILFNYISGYKNHHFEIGAGITFAFDRRYNSKITKFDPDYFGATTNLMYRYQKPKGKFIFRAG